MAAPPKPWERVGVNNQNAAPNLTNQLQGSSSVPPCCQPGGGGPLDPLRQSGASQAPPPIPTRPSQQSASPYSSYGGYGGGYNSYGGLGSYGGFGTGGMYSQYGSGLYGSSMHGNSMYGGLGMNRFGAQDPNNSFVRMAEENSRQAFQSIEGIVQAFGSVSMMLESTYSAVYNSFRAVIGVADHFSRMKTHFAQIFSALAVLKTLKWMLRKLLVLMRLREAVPDDELWMQAATAGMDAADKLPGSKKSSTSWPLLLFFAVIVGGPWLIWRFLSSLTSQAGSNWATGEEDHFVALAEHNFNGENDEELTFKSGQRIFIAPKELQPRMRGWLLGAVDGKTGILPAAYVKILGKRRGTKFAPPAPAPPPDPQQQYTGPAPLPSSSSHSCCGGSSATTSSDPEKGLSVGPPPNTSSTTSCCKSSSKGCGQESSEANSQSSMFESAMNEFDPNESLDLVNNQHSQPGFPPDQSVNEKEAVDILDNSS